MTTQTIQTQLAVDKIRQIGQDILDEPRRFDMSMFFCKLTPDTLQDAQRTARTAPPCGTVACFAGEWAIRYLGVDPGSDDPDYQVLRILENRSLLGGGSSLPKACRLDLGLPTESLFFTSSWPPRLRDGIERFNPGTKAYARYFVKVVLEDYIRTNGWTST